MASKKQIAEVLRDAALAYADSGFFVFPCEPQGKRPLTRHGVNDSTRDPETIVQWWLDHPQANIGIDCGRSGLVVLDIDVKNGKDARPAVADKDLSGAVTVTTPSGGLHYYYKTGGEKFQSGASLYGYDGLDVRSAGGYVVAPPSCVIVEDGEQARRYKRVSGDFGKLSDAPSWLIEWERGRQSSKIANTDMSGAVDVEPMEADDGVLKRATAYLEKMPPAISGNGGHDAALKAATVLVVGFRLSDGDALSLLTTAYNPRCKPSWSRSELSHKVAEARKNKLGKRPGYLLAHGTALTNYVTETREGRKGKTYEVNVPRQLVDIVSDLRSRFDGFPKRLGERLFYLDESRTVQQLVSPDALSAWVQRCCGCGVDFLTGHGFVKLREVYEALLQTSERFDAVSRAPFFPERPDVFSLTGELPPPSEGAAAFWKLLDFMCPATEEDRLLMAMFFCCPMYFSPAGDFDRPGIYVDTEDAQASGKTSVVEICAKIYDCIPLGLDFATLDRAQEQAKKRILSSEGRATRIALFDNVRSSTIKSPVLANLITSKHITERAAYGRGEESRPNDLAFCVTVNGGTFDTDLASRFYPVIIREPDSATAFWKRRVFSYIDANRPQILSDIRDMIRRALERTEKGDVWSRRKSRFPEFDAVVLSAVCRSRTEFDAVDKRLSALMADANDDRDRAATFEAVLMREFRSAAGIVDELPVVVFASDIDQMIVSTDELSRLRFTSRDVRSWIKSGLLPGWSKDFRKIANAKNYGDDMGGAAFLFGLDRFRGPDGAAQVARRSWDASRRQGAWRFVAQFNLRRPS